MSPVNQPVPLTHAITSTHGIRPARASLQSPHYPPTSALIQHERARSVDNSMKQYSKLDPVKDPSPASAVQSHTDTNQPLQHSGQSRHKPSARVFQSPTLTNAQSLHDARVNNPKTSSPDVVSHPTEPSPILYAA